MRRLAIFLALAAVPGSNSHDCLAQKTVPHGMQRTFYPDTDDSFEGAVPVSEAVAKAIATFNKTIDVPPSEADMDLGKQFEAKSVDLRLGGEDDLIVHGLKAMRGADNDWFWIVLDAKSHPRVVAWVGGNGLSILKQKTRGLADIRMTWNSAAGGFDQRLRFDGRRYIAAKKHCFEFSHSFSKGKTVPCPK